MEASPTPPLIITEAEFLLEFAIITLDAPAQFRRLHRPDIIDLASPEPDRRIS